MYILVLLYTELYTEDTTNGTTLLYPAESAVSLLEINRFIQLLQIYDSFWLINIMIKHFFPDGRGLFQDDSAPTVYICPLFGFSTSIIKTLHVENVFTLMQHMLNIYAHH